MKGIVVSLKNKKTAGVKVNRVFRHPSLFKIIHRSKNFSCQVPDDLNLSLGQAVEIRQTSPRSAGKSWLVFEIYG